MRTVAVIHYPELIILSVKIQSMSFHTVIPETPELASGDHRDSRAPAIQADEAFASQVENAEFEFKIRKRLREHDPNAVTDQELKASRRRLVAIETLDAQISHGMGNGAILTAIHDLAARMDARMDALGARMTNIRRRKRNRSGDAWLPILVEHVGPNAVGQPPANFPANREAVFGLNGAAITALEASFNLPAGFFGGGTLAARRVALMDYLTDE